MTGFIVDGANFMFGSVANGVCARMNDKYTEKADGQTKVKWGSIGKDIASYATPIAWGTTVARGGWSHIISHPRASLALGIAALSSVAYHSFNTRQRNGELVRENVAVVTRAQQLNALCADQALKISKLEAEKEIQTKQLDLHQRFLKGRSLEDEFNLQLGRQPPEEETERLIKEAPKKVAQSSQYIDFALGAVSVFDMFV